MGDVAVSATCDIILLHFALFDFCIENCQSCGNQQYNRYKRQTCDTDAASFSAQAQILPIDKRRVNGFIDFEPISVEQLFLVGLFTGFVEAAARSAAQRTLAFVVRVEEPSCSLHRTENDESVLDAILVTFHYLNVLF